MAGWTKTPAGGDAGQSVVSRFLTILSAIRLASNIFVSARPLASLSQTAKKSRFSWGFIRFPSRGGGWHNDCRAIRAGGAVASSVGN